MADLSHKIRGKIIYSDGTQESDEDYNKYVKKQLKWLKGLKKKLERRKKE